MKKITALFCAVVFSFLGCLSAYATEISDVSAKAAVVVDGDTGDILYQKNADKQLPVASTTKIMSVILAIENGKLDEEFTVDCNAVKTEGSSMGLKENDVVTMRALCYGMMLPSGNDAAHCAAVRISGSIEKFVELMNHKAEELGMNSTHFVTPSGLDDNTDEHYSTANDMALLTRYAMENKTFCEICGTKQVKLHFGNPAYDRWLTNSNKLLKNCEGVIGVKTGFTDKAGRCLVSACERNGKKLICVTLNASDDWRDHSMLFDKCYSYFSEQTLPLETNCFNVNVVGGCSDSVRCFTTAASAVLLNGRADEVTSVVKLPLFVYATVKEEQQIGSVEYYYEGRKIAEKGIYPAENVYYQKSADKGFLEELKSRICAVIAR